MHGGYGNRNGGEIESEGLQTDTERNGTDLLSSDKGTPLRNSLKDVSPTDDYLLEENKQLKEAVETLKAEMKLSVKHNRELHNISQVVETPTSTNFLYLHLNYGGAKTPP